MACDQYSSVSNALDRSAEKMCSSFFVMFASSISSARILIGSWICLPFMPPYCSPRSMLLSSITVLILEKITLSNSLSTTSISAIGLVLLMSYRPASVLGSGLRSVMFHDTGTCSPSSTMRFIVSASLSRLSSLISFIISIVTPEAPGAFPDLNFISSRLRSPTLTRFITASHMLRSLCSWL